jgi:hypothetical protein
MSVDLHPALPVQLNPWVGILDHRLSLQEAPQDSVQLNREVIRTHRYMMLWLPPNKIPSGKTTEDILTDIRKNYFKVKHEETIKAALEKKKVSDSDYEDEYKDMADSFEFDASKDFPKEWLTFLFLGKPDYIGFGVQDGYNEGHAVSSKQVKLTAPPEITAAAASGLLTLAVMTT